MLIDPMSELPSCICGKEEWKGSGGHMDVKCDPPFATDNFSCTHCGRIALAQGFKGTPAYFMLILKQPGTKFPRSVTAWVRGSLSKLFEELQRTDTFDAVIEIPNPLQDEVELYFPDAQGTWVKINTR